jgi:hypothetical protein
MIESHALLVAYVLVVELSTFVLLARRARATRAGRGRGLEP